MNNLPKIISHSDKLRIVNESTFKRYSEIVYTAPRKYKKFRPVPDLSYFIKTKPKYKKIKTKRSDSLPIYKFKKTKSVTKTGTKKKSKLKKTILKYRLYKRNLDKDSNQCQATNEVIKDIENLTLQEVPSVSSNPKAVHSRRFREYCDNTTSQELCNLVDNVLRKLNFFQKRAFHNNNFKAKSRRRIVVGFREVQVQMKIDKIKCVIIATDCEKCEFGDGLDNIIKEIKEHCKKENLPCAYAMSRRQLSYTLNKKCPISCVGIVDFDGAQDEYFKMLQALEVEKFNYTKFFSTNI